MNKIKDLPIEERPRERLIKNTAQYLSNEDLLTLLIKTGTPSKSAKDISINLLEQIKDIKSLQDISYYNLLKIDGIGQAKATTILAAIELGNRVNTEINSISNIKFNNPELVFKYYKDILKNKKQEYFYCVYLDNAKTIINDKLLFVGTVNQSLVHPREVFKEAYNLSASFIICVHNHPTNNVLPSIDDIRITKQLKEIGKLQGVFVIDHIIIGKTKYYSMFENNDLGD